MGISRQLFLTFVAASLMGCSYRVQKNEGTGEVPVFSRAQLSFSYVQMSVFSRNCASCHGNSGGVNLESYAAVISNLGKISDAVFVKQSMPKSPGAPLTAAQLALLRQWIALGAPQNGPSELPPPPVQPTFASIHDLILAKKCLQCHNPSGHAKDVPLNTLEEIMKSPDDLIVPRDPDSSYLYLVVAPGARKPMPPPDSGITPLSEQELGALREWISHGATD